MTQNPPIIGDLLESARTTSPAATPDVVESFRQYVRDVDAGNICLGGSSVAPESVAEISARSPRLAFTVATGYSLGVYAVGAGLAGMVVASGAGESLVSNILKPAMDTAGTSLVNLASGIGSDVITDFMINHVKPVMDSAVNTVDRTSKILLNDYAIPTIEGLGVVAVASTMRLKEIFRLSGGVANMPLNMRRLGSVVATAAGVAATGPILQLPDNLPDDMAVLPVTARTSQDTTPKCEASYRTPDGLRLVKVVRTDGCGLPKSTDALATRFAPQANQDNFVRSEMAARENIARISGQAERQAKLEPAIAIPVGHPSGLRSELR